MSTFNFIDYLEIKKQANLMRITENCADKSFMDEIKSKKNWKNFLQLHSDNINLSDFDNMSFCKLEKGFKSNDYYFKWNTISNNQEKLCCSKDMPINTILNFFQNN